MLFRALVQKSLPYSIRGASCRSMPIAAVSGPAARRNVCMPPRRPGLDSSEDMDAFETSSKCKPVDVAAADGITPEAALAELRKLRNTPHLTPDDLGIHIPTPIAPFTDVDPITGKVLGAKKKGFFSKRNSTPA